MSEHCVEEELELKILNREKMETLKSGRVLVLGVLGGTTVGDVASCDW